MKYKRFTLDFTHSYRYIKIYNEELTLGRNCSCSSRADNLLCKLIMLLLYFSSAAFAMK